MADLPLNAFPATDDAHWRKLVEGVLKGGAFEKLVGKTYDGIAIQPLYPPAKVSPRALRGQGGPWTIMARIDHPDAGEANAQALTDLANGATGLHIVFAQSPAAYGFGLTDASPAAVAQLFEGIHLDAGVAIEIDPSPQSKDFADSFAALVKARGYDASALDMSFGFNPFGVIAASGKTPAPWDQIAPLFSGVIADLRAKGFKGPFATADGRVVHAAGGSEAQELAFALSSGLAYLRALEASGIALDQARECIAFRLASDADEFVSLAKFRALRLLWARIEDACGLTPKPILVHAETAWRMTSRRDPWVNLLRTTVAIFSAALGGADRISVLPFTQSLGLPDEFARRLARNAQLVLLEESNLDKVADPAAGAGGFEALTHDLCEAAWKIFQSLEGAGGLGASLATGTFQSDVAKIFAAREANVARRKDPLTGVSEFPNLGEASVKVLKPLALDADVTPAGIGTSFAKPMSPVRVSARFEALADRAAVTGPKVFLANLGPVSAFSARAMFAKNYFEAGGIAALSNDGFEDTTALVDAWKKSGAALVCICSSDAIYAERAESVAKALAGAGAKTLYLAGRPGDAEAAYRVAGVTHFIFAGGNVLAILEEALALAS